MRQKSEPNKPPAEAVIERDPSPNAQTLWRGGKDPHRARRSSWRGQHRRTLPPGRTEPEPLLSDTSKNLF